MRKLSIKLFLYLADAKLQSRILSNLDIEYHELASIRRIKIKYQQFNGKEFFIIKKFSIS